jgi:hypothetical protein
VVALDVLLGGLRLHVLCRALFPRASLALAARAYLVNLFAAAVTPLQAGAGPAQLLVLVRGGLPASRAVAVLALNFVGILTALLGLAVLGAAFLLLGLAGAGHGPPVTVIVPLLIGAAAVAASAVAVLSSPSLGLSLARRMGRRPSLRPLAERLMAALSDYRASTGLLARRHRAAWAASAALSWLLFLNKATAAFLVLHALGGSASYLEVVARQGLQLLVVYFSPSPGASGIAEATAPVFMAGSLPAGRSLEFTLLWRAATSYAGVALGALAAVGTLTRRGEGAGT